MNRKTLDDEVKQVFLGVPGFDEQREVVRRSGAGLRTLLAWAVFLFVAGAITWASFSEIDASIRGMGRVIPNSSPQVIQSLEGGIVEELFVSVGDVVKVGQELLRLHDVQFSAIHESKMARRDALKARMARLWAEANEEESITFEPYLLKERPELVALENSTFTKRRNERETLLRIAREKLEKRRSLYETLKPAYESGSISMADQLGLEGDILDIEESIATIELGFARRVQEQYDEEREQFATLVEEMAGDLDRVSRAVIESPIDGVVNELHIDTAGRVVAGGEPIMEIVPEGDNLLIEARIRPADIAFLRSGQPTKVTFTAYDFSIYGGLEGEVETIGVNTVLDEATGEEFYPIKVRTNENSLGINSDTGEPMTLVPGMVAEVRLIIGKRTILEYLMKPITRAKQFALREM